MAEYTREVFYVWCDAVARWGPCCLKAIMDPAWWTRRSGANHFEQRLVERSSTLINTRASEYRIHESLRVVLVKMLAGEHTTG